MGYGGGGVGATHQCSLVTAACDLLVMLTLALLMTSSYSADRLHAGTVVVAHWEKVCARDLVGDMVDHDDDRAFRGVRPRRDRTAVA